MLSLTSLAPSIACLILATPLLHDAMSQASPLLYSLDWSLLGQGCRQLFASVLPEVAQRRLRAENGFQAKWFLVQC